MTTLRNCRIGTYAYIQVGELSNQIIPPGKVWITNYDLFDFNYVFPPEILRQKYIAFEPEKGTAGLFMDFVEDKKPDFQSLFDAPFLEPPAQKNPPGTSFNRYSVWKGKNQISKNVLVAQRAYLESSWLGDGANAQENFGEGSIIMFHTSIELMEPVTAPDHHVVWGYIRSLKDLKEHSISLDKLSKVKGKLNIGRMPFQGDGEVFADTFRHRIEHILEANGAFFNGKTKRGHAQKSQNISFNLLRPYSSGNLKGLFPTVDIGP